MLWLYFYREMCFFLMNIFNLSRYSAYSLHVKHVKGGCYAFLVIFFKDLFIYLFLERAEGWKKERETLICCLLQAPNQGPGLQPRHVPKWLFGLQDLPSFLKAHIITDVSPPPSSLSPCCLCMKFHIMYICICVYNLLKWNLYNIKLTILKWVIQWDLVHSVTQQVPLPIYN